MIFNLEVFPTTIIQCEDKRDNFRHENSKKQNKKAVISHAPFLESKGYVPAKQSEVRKWKP